MSNEVKTKLNPQWRKARAACSWSVDVWASMEAVEGAGERYDYPTAASIAATAAWIRDMVEEMDGAFLALQGLALNSKRRWPKETEDGRDVRLRAAIALVCRRIVFRGVEGLPRLYDEDGLPYAQDDDRRRELNRRPDLKPIVGPEGHSAEYLEMLDRKRAAVEAMDAYAVFTGFPVKDAACKVRPLKGKWSGAGIRGRRSYAWQAAARHRKTVDDFLDWWAEKLVGPKYLVVRESVAQPPVESGDAVLSA